MAVKVTIERSYPVGEAATPENPPTTLNIEADSVSEAFDALNELENSLGYTNN
jgi:hypothetical protein